MVLNWVVVAICENSVTRLCASWLAAARSDGVLSAEDACTESCLSLCRMEVRVLTPPVAVWTSDTALFALFTAWLSPPTWALNLVAMARPAGSSAALLIRRPDESLWSDVANAALLMETFLWAFKLGMFVLTVKAMISSLILFSG